MSLSSALSTAVSGLSAQSQALSSISRNIANASTTAYKTTETDFQALVSGALTSTSSGGVVARPLQAMTVQGGIAGSDVTTNMAIKGSGFFVVADKSTDSPSSFVYTRDGSFAPDADGYLVNDAGYYLQGFATDATGKVTATNDSDLSNLKPINLSSIGGTAKATSQINMSANLPADAAIGDTFTTSMTMIDSLGVSQTIDQSWNKTAANSWTLSLSNPKLTSDPTVTSGAISPGSIAVTFDSSGVLSSTNPNPATLSVTGLSTGAANSTITLNLGAVGKTDGVTQFSSTSSTPSIENPAFTQDGALYGKVSGISIDDAGLVTATFDNGVKQPIYQVPIATFANPGGLTQVSGTIYSGAQAAGNVALTLPNDGTAGSIVADSLEGSSSDIATEFNKMIVAQQAYSAASQVITTVKSMFDTLTSAMR